MALTQKFKNKILSILTPLAKSGGCIDYEYFFSAIFSEFPINQSYSGHNKATSVIKKMLLNSNLTALAIRKEQAWFIDEKNKVLIQVRPYEEYGIEIYFCASSDEDQIERYKNIILSTKANNDKKKKKKNSGRIYVLSERIKKTKNGDFPYLLFAPFKIPPFELDVSENYNDDFLPVHEEIIRELDVKDGNGVVILHGSPGTGKTYYLRYLCKILKKKILFIPPSLVSSMTDPSFVNILSKHKNSIMLIEDADNVLRKRDEASDIQTISSILNIADGMLTDVLKLQIVATFNTNLSNIDSAFLRKGRLIATHEFKPLNASKAQKLSDKLGFSTKIEKDTSLADIYNQHKVNFAEGKDKKRVGFAKN
jgi:hypothetical protein